MLTIVSLEVENFKRLKAVRIEPSGHTVVLGGKNGAGKSSVLDAIWCGLGGGKVAPEVPIRHGESRAQIVLDLGDLVVERKFTTNGTQLVVRGRDGRSYSNPQALLDDLCSKLTFDPLAFTRMDGKAQAEQLRQLVGLDFAALDEERKRTFDERTGVNRVYKAAEARVNGLTRYPDAPAAEVSLVDAMAQLSAAESANLGRQQALNAVEALKREGAEIRRQQAEVGTQIEALRRQLDELERRHAELGERFEAKKAEYARTRAEAEAMPEADTTQLRAWVNDLEATNQRVRANQQWTAQAAERDRLAEDWARLDTRIKEIDADKARQVREARYPVEGLAVNDSGVTLNGLPLEQASSAEQLRVSLAIGLELNPELRVMLIRDGSLLDLNSLRIVKELAADRQAQIWVERVGQGEEIQILIEDGEAIDPTTGEKLDGSAALSKCAEALLGLEEEASFAASMGLAPATPEAPAAELVLAGTPTIDDPFADQ